MLVVRRHGIKVPLLSNFHIRTLSSDNFAQLTKSISASRPVKVHQDAKKPTGTTESDSMLHDVLEALKDANSRSKEQRHSTDAQQRRLRRLLSTTIPGYSHEIPNNIDWKPSTGREKRIPLAEAMRGEKLLQVPHLLSLFSLYPYYLFLSPSLFLTFSIGTGETCCFATS